MEKWEENHPVRVLAKRLERMSLVLRMLPDCISHLHNDPRKKQMLPASREAQMDMERKGIADFRAELQAGVRDTFELSKGLAKHLEYGMTAPGIFETELRQSIKRLRAELAIEERAWMPPRHPGFSTEAEKLGEVALQDPSSPGSRTRKRKSAIPPPISSLEQEIVTALRRANKRLPGRQLIEKAQGTYNSYGKAVLAAMVKKGLLTSRRDVRPSGYGLPQWTDR